VLISDFELFLNLLSDNVRTDRQRTYRQTPKYKSLILLRVTCTYRYSSGTNIVDCTESHSYVSFLSITISTYLPVRTEETPLIAYEQQLGSGLRKSELLQKLELLRAHTDKT
jgi:hypothetical protein